MTRDIPRLLSSKDTVRISPVLTKRGEFAQRRYML